MKMNGTELADLIIHSFLRGVEHKEDLSDTLDENLVKAPNIDANNIRVLKIDANNITAVEDALDEYYLFRPVEGEDGDWDYNDET